MPEIISTLRALHSPFDCVSDSVCNHDYAHFTQVMAQWVEAAPERLAAEQVRDPCSWRVAIPSLICVPRQLLPSKPILHVSPPK